MTQAQWLFEYVSLKDKEKEDFEFVQMSFKALKRMLVNLLGLNLMNSKEDTEKMTETELENVFVPLAVMAGRREVVEHILKKFKDEEQPEIKPDDEFEKLSQAIARGDDLGDMAPIIDIDEKTDEKLKSYFNPGKEAQYQRLGIKIIENQTRSVPTIKLNIQEMNERRAQQSRKHRESNESLIKHLQEEQKELHSRGVKLTFNDEWH